MTFAREQLRSPFSVLLLVAVPVVFVLVADEVLAQFSTALGEVICRGGWRPRSRRGERRRL